MSKFNLVQFYIENALPSPQQMWNKLNDSKMIKANQFFEKSLFEKLQEVLRG